MKILKKENLLILADWLESNVSQEFFDMEYFRADEMHGYQDDYFKISKTRVVGYNASIGYEGKLQDGEFNFESSIDGELFTIGNLLGWAVLCPNFTPTYKNFDFVERTFSLRSYTRTHFFYKFHDVAEKDAHKKTDYLLRYKTHEENFRNYFDYLFSTRWHTVDNTLSGSIKRLRKVAKDGLPNDWENQLLGAAALTYKTNIFNPFGNNLNL